jgi:cytosine/adenosine deaminase-related metal-dependent hydrolase
VDFGSRVRYADDMIIKADDILTLAQDDFSPGQIRIDAQRIAEVSSNVNDSDEKVLDLKNIFGPNRRAVIIPGLVDAHCHLELSGLAGKIKLRSGDTLVDWLMKIVLKRPMLNSTQDRWVKIGADQALRSGTTTVGDISANNRSWQTLIHHPLRKVCFAEVLGFGPKAPRAIPSLMERLAEMPMDTEMFYRGVSPHAPYSTSEIVYRQAMELANQNHWRLTTHLAEDPQELEFVRTGGGRWRTILKGIFAWDESYKPSGLSPIAWAREIGLLDRPFSLAHVNYANDDDIAILAQSSASVVYCPLAHTYFHHKYHRYREMISAGVNVALGCDSLACSPSLSMFDQMRSVYAAGGLDARDVLKLATLNGAESLQLSNQIGSLEPGKFADILILSVNREISDDGMVEAVFQPDAQLEAVMIGGQFVHLRDQSLFFSR